MRITKDKFNKTLEEVMGKNKSEFYKYRVEDLYFHNVDIKKTRNSESYDIIVSISELEVSLTLIRDLIDETCEALGIIRNKLMLEI